MLHRSARLGSRLVRLVAVAALTLTVTACSWGGPLADLPEHVQAQLDAAPAAQRAAIADGDVSLADVERAAEAVAACLRRMGVAQVSVDHSPSARPGLPGQFGWTYAVSGPGSELGGSAASEDEAGRLLDGCYAEHFGAIWALYEHQNTDPRVAAEHQRDLLGGTGGG